MSIQKIIPTVFSEVFLIENERFPDDRGEFVQNFQKEDFDKKIAEHTDKKYNFIQDNTSWSAKNVIRGFHYQLKNPQAKLVTVLGGSIIDNIIDIRKDSETFGEYISILMGKPYHRQLLIPEGFAHGFRALEDNTLVSYKTTNNYCKGDEYGIIYNDPNIPIDWTFGGMFKLEQNEKYIVSNKDLAYHELMFTEPSKLF
jgi:dTDP-4-dehydrorhamnose 3,5-epimerase